jgi:hypothetical protein
MIRVYGNDDGQPDTATTPIVVVLLLIPVDSVVRAAVDE